MVIYSKYKKVFEKSQQNLLFQLFYMLVAVICGSLIFSFVEQILFYQTLGNIFQFYFILTTL